MTARALVILAVLAALAAGGLGARELARHTRLEVRPGAAGTAPAVIFDIRVHRFGQGERVGAAALWQLCLANEPGRPTSPAPAGPHRYRATITPALSSGPIARLRGCLTDVSVDGVRGHVERIRSS